MTDLSFRQRDAKTGRFLPVPIRTPACAIKYRGTCPAWCGIDHEHSVERYGSEVATLDVKTERDGTGAVTYYDHPAIAPIPFRSVVAIPDTIHEPESVVHHASMQNPGSMYEERRQTPRLRVEPFEHPLREAKRERIRRAEISVIAAAEAWCAPYTPGKFYRERMSVLENSVADLREARRS